VVAPALRITKERSHAARALYQAQDSNQTLLDALEEYYGRNLGRVRRPSDLAPESAALFRSHDLCHVIFGLDTSLADEAMADVRTLASCDVGWRRYATYMTRDPEAKAIFKELGYPRAIGITLWVIPRMVRALFEAARAAKRWPWEPPAEFEARSLSDLRREHGIRVI
jgi:hypothetical protein